MKKFLIKKGNHYPKGIHFGITLKKSIKFICKFDKSCLYDLKSNDNYDVNKLFGFSTTWFHQKQSARVGWRCIDRKHIQIVTYSYNNSKRALDDLDILGEVLPNEEFVCTITDMGESYRYTFQKLSDELIVIAHDKKQRDWFFFHYLLFPYFGGNQTAPHDMIIYLKQIR